MVNRLFVRGWPLSVALVSKAVLAKELVKRHFRPEVTLNRLTQAAGFEPFGVEILIRREVRWVKPISPQVLLECNWKLLLQV